MRWAGGAGKPLPHYGKTAVCAASVAWGKLLLHMKKRRSSPLFERKPAVFRQKKALTAPSGTRQRALLLSFTTKKRRCVGILFRAILLPSRHRAFALRLQPTFSGVHSQWRIFVHTAFAASVASLRSQCRPRGVLRPIPSKLPPDQIGLYSVQPHDFTGSYSIIIILSYREKPRARKNSALRMCSFSYRISV